MKINALIDKLSILRNIFFLVVMLMFVTNLTLRGREKYEFYIYIYIHKNLFCRHLMVKLVMKMYEKPF